MKKEELKQAIVELKAIKDLTDKENYLLSSAVNEKYIIVNNLLNEELKRMDNQKVEVTSPKIMIIQKKSNTVPFTDVINKQLENLVMNDFKVLDYYVCEDLETAVIKYTG